MALQGTLDTFSLPDVLRLLATTAKTGRLQIDGDRGRGSIWLADGRVVDAAADRTLDGTPVDEVVFELRRFEAGSFTFDGGDPGSGAGQPEEVEALLRRADALLGEWGELEAVVPSLEHEVSLATDLSADEVTISADSWQSLVAVAPGRTVGELATTLGLTELAVSRIVRDLVELGVVDVTRPGPPRSASGRPRRDGLVAGGDSRAHDERAVAPAPPAAASRPRRAGWLTGEHPVTVPETAPPQGRNGVAPATPDPGSLVPEPDPAPRGGLVSRLGRRNGSVGRGSGVTPTEPTPAVPDPPRAAGSPPPAPAARAAEGPRASRPAAGDLPSPRGAGARRSDAAPPATPAADRSGPLGPPPLGRDAAGPGTPAPFEEGHTAPRAVGPDTGSTRAVPPSVPPPDLRWAADDTGGVPPSGGGASPFSGLSSMGASGSGPAEGEVAPHVSAMSPEARTAVQATVGNSGGSTGARVASQGEDIAQRGRLISFLSSVR